MLIYYSPGGGEKYFEEMSLIPNDDPESREKCTQLDAKYGITILKSNI